MASTGQLFTVSISNVDRAGNTAWTNPTNANANDGVDTSAAVPTDYLVFGSFAASLPSNAVILGITVRVEASETGTGNSNYTVQLCSDGTPTLIGSSKGPVTVNGTTPTVSTNGSASDVWGATLNPAIVNASGFGFAIWSTDTTNTLSIDYATIEIEYQVLKGLALLGVG